MPQQTKPTEKDIIQVTDLVKRYGDFTAVDGITFIPKSDRNATG